MTFGLLLKMTDCLIGKILEWQIVCQDVHVNKATEMVLIAQGE